MNLDSLSLALSHISYIVANLTKKTYKSSVAEISHLKARHGAEADRHLCRCLFSHVDFSGDGKGSGKDLYQTQYLIQECSSLIAKPNFVSILCYSVDNPLHHQKTLKPSQHLLPQFSKLLKLNRLQEVIFGLALLNSSIPETRKHAATFVRQTLPHLLAAYLEPAETSSVDSGLKDAVVEVLHQLLVSLRGKETFGISAEQKEAFFKALQKKFPQDQVPVVLAPLLYPDCEDLLLTRLDPNAVPIPPLMMEISLADMIKEVGYGFTSSIEECRNTLMQFGAREITPESVARVLGAMAQTPSGLADQIGVQTLGSSSPWTENKDKPDVAGPQSWNVNIFVQVIHDLAPHLSWREVVKHLDYPGFAVTGKPGLQLLVHALNRGLQDLFPVDMIYQLWSNTEGQLSWLTQSLRNPDVFCFADYACHMVVMDILKSPPDEENRELAPWKSLDLVETLLRLSDAGHYQMVSELFNLPLQQCPDILVLSLLQIQTWNTLKHELLSRVMPIFLGNHPNSAVVLHYAWHCQNQSTTIRTLVMHAMAEWYMHGEHHDQSRLARILDVSQDLKALSMLLNATPFAFVIDLACLASRREYLKLDKWLSDKIREHGEPFMHACVHFLKVRCPQLMGSPDDPKPQSKSQQLPSETLNVMLTCMQACLGNVSKELSDGIMMMMTNASVVMKSRQLGPPPPPPSVPGPPKVNIAQGLPGLPSATPPNPMDQLGGIGVGALGGSTSASSASVNSPFPSSLGSLTAAAPGSPAKSFPNLGQPASQPQPFNPMGGLPTQLSVTGQPTSQAQLFTPMGLPSLPSGLTSQSSVASSQPPSFNPMQGLPAPLSSNMGNLGQPSSQAQSFNPMQGLTSQLQGLGMSTTMSSTLTSRVTPTLGALSAQAAGLKQPQTPNPVDRLRQGTSASAAPGGGEVSSIFPAMNQQFSKEIEDKANSYFQRIYNPRPSIHPSVSIQPSSIDEVLDMLKRFKDSTVKEEREVFSCMLRNLFEEYRFFPQYPDKELNTTAVLFGGIIEQGLVTYMDLGIALRYVLEALKKPHASKMYYFGIAALDKFRTRLKDYPQYCHHLSGIPHFTNFPQHLKEYVEYGARSEEPANRPQGPVITRSLTPVSVAATTTSTTSATTTAVTTTSTTPTPTPSAIARPTPVAPARPSIATATSIETLLAGTDSKEEMAIPPEALQDKVFFIFNNLSLANMEQKSAELRDNMTEEFMPWMGQYLVMKRASIEANFHVLYANFIDYLKKADFLPLVIRETFRNIKVLLRSDKGVANFSDRSLLKNLGHWLGMLTLAKNKPIMHLDIDLKSLLYEAYHKGSQELLYVVPFVAKVIESCAKSKVFRPPNPWTLAIMNVLAELHQEPDLKLNLKFEIEVLCKNLSIDIGELKPGQYLKDMDRLSRLEQQLSAPRPAKECSTPQPEEPLQINMPTPTATVVTTAPTPTTSTTTSVVAPPQPQFAYQEINTLSMAGLAPHIQINEQLGLFQAHPQMKQFVRAAIERSVQELLPPVVERSIKIGLTTCEQIVKKDFALDPEEMRLRAAAHHMVRFMTAGMALITCREPLLLSINTNLKNTFLQTLRGATQPQKELIEQAAQILAQDNVELACVFIQKTAVEKAIPEIDKRLATDYDLRKHARNESRRYCDPVVLTYQAERMPEQIRLKVGGVTPHQIAVYEEFARNIPGFMSTAQESAQAGQYMVRPMQTYATDEISQIYDKIARDIEQQLHLSIAPHNTPQMQALGGLLEAVILARTSREIVTALSLLQKAVDGLLEGLTLAATDQEMMIRYRDCHLLVLKGLQDHRAYGPQWTNKHVTKRLIECREEHRYNIEAIDYLIRSHLVNMQQYDMHIAQSMDNGLNYMAVAFAMQLVQRFCVDDKSSTQLNENQQVSFQADFYNTIETLGRIATHSRQAPDGLATLIDTIRQHNDGGLLDRAPGGPQSMLSSGISQAREFDDPPGLHEKTEFLLREWVNMYHSPGAGRDSTKAFSAFVTQMHQQGILKTDDLITRFFRLCTEMCVDLCYRALTDQTHSPTLVRAKCFHTLDAFVRLIALLVKHSGDTSNTVTKINLLNKVLGIVAGVLLQDHEVRHTDFQQLPYHRIFIMLFIELNAPEHVLESINFQVLTAFCNTFHILRPSKAPGFSYAWLELVSHRVFIGRMLAITPDQRGWSMYAQLLIDLFKFLSPFLRNAELAKPTQLLYKGTLRVLLVLLHDFPEFLCDYHYAFCDVIPPNCIQMRNLILSAFPRNMRLPDPFTPNLKVDMLPEIGHPPRIMTNVFTMIQPATFKKDLDSYLKIRSPVTFLSDLRSNLQVSNEPGMRYNIPLINALVLYVGMQAIAHIHSKSLTPSMTTIAHSSHMDIFQNLSVDLDTEGRYLFLNAIANQLRYPNSHTHYFSCTLLYLFAEANTEAIQEQITRVLLERLIVNRPHPWGLLITFIEMIRNPSFKFWNHEFVHCAPEIEKLFESVARSCMQPKQSQVMREPETHEVH